MSNAKRDNNRVPTIVGVSDSDGSTSIAFLADPDTHRLIISDGTTGSDLTGDNAKRDANSEPSILGTSDVDATTPVPVYATDAGALKIKST